MQDITIPQDDCEQSSANSDDAQDNQDDWNPSDSDADYGNESASSGSENEDPGTTVMLLLMRLAIVPLSLYELTVGLKVTSLITDKQQEASHGTSKSEFV